MAILWQILSNEDRQKLADFYEETFGKAFLPPPKHEKAINIEPKLEDISEIDKLMRQKGRGAWHE